MARTVGEVLGLQFEEEERRMSPRTTGEALGLFPPVMDEGNGIYDDSALEGMLGAMGGGRGRDTTPPDKDLSTLNPQVSFGVPQEDRDPLNIGTAFSNILPNYRTSMGGKNLLSAQRLEWGLDDAAVAKDQADIAAIPGVTPVEQAMMLRSAGAKMRGDVESQESIDAELRARAAGLRADAEQTIKAGEAGRTNYEMPDSGILPYVLQAIENSGFSLASGARSGAAWGLGGPLGGLLMSLYNTIDESATEAGEAARDRGRDGASREEIQRAADETQNRNMALLALSNTVGDTLTFGKLWPKLAEKIGGDGILSSVARGVVSKGAPVVSNALPEYGEEFGQELIQQTAGKDNVDWSKLDYAKAREAGLLGLTGGILHGGAGLATRAGMDALLGRKEKTTRETGKKPDPVAPASIEEAKTFEDVLDAMDAMEEEPPAERRQEKPVETASPIDDKAREDFKRLRTVPLNRMTDEERTKFKAITTSLRLRREGDADGAKAALESVYGAQETEVPVASSPHDDRAREDFRRLSLIPQNRLTQDEKKLFRTLLSVGKMHREGNTEGAVNALNEAYGEVAATAEESTGNVVPAETREAVVEPPVQGLPTQEGVPPSGLEVVQPEAVPADKPLRIGNREIPVRTETGEGETIIPGERRTPPQTVENAPVSSFPQEEAPIPSQANIVQPDAVSAVPGAEERVQTPPDTPRSLDDVKAEIRGMTKAQIAETYGPEVVKQRGLDATAKAVLEAETKEAPAVDAPIDETPPRVPFGEMTGKMLADEETAIREAKIEELTSAGKSREQAEADATVYARAARVAATKRRMSPLEWEESRGLRVRQGKAEEVETQAKEGKNYSQFAGPKAQTADPLALSKAQEMSGKGASNEDVRRDTGWFKGMDGKWRFEISDRGSSWIGDASEGMHTGRLSDVIDHPVLFKAYPDLADIPVVWRIGMDIEKPHGRYYEPRKRENLDLADIKEQIEIEARDTTEARENLLHEIQHTLQARENFARGGSPALGLNQRGEAIYKEMKVKVDEKMRPVGEAINDLTNRIKKAEAEGDTSTVSSLTEKRSDLWETLDELQAEKLNLASRAAYEEYYRRAGEIEARDTASRRRLDDKGRKSSEPELRSDAIIVWGGEEMEYRPQAATTNKPSTDADYLSAVEAGDMETAQRMVDEAARRAGYVVQNVHHGTKRIDRVGNRMDPKRATSGPMPFFTDDPNIAENYSKKKNDNSLEIPDSFEAWFKVKVGRGKPKSISDAWYYMTPEQKRKINSLLPHVVNVDENGNEMDGFRIDESRYGLSDKGHWDFTIKESRGNTLMAAVDIWLNSGELYDLEEGFVEVLRLGGVENVTYESPWTEVPGVVDAHLMIRNPLNTSKVDEDLFNALSAASKRKRGSRKFGVDQWDKRAVSGKQWIERLENDMREGTTYTWTTIPDWVTKVLIDRGYDGIKDSGGKYTGNMHTVWIPFFPWQVKRSDPVVYDDSGKIIPLSQRFDAGKEDIRYQSAWHGSPHRFERFSLHAIGSGEGAQAYGWGLYFAGNRDTGEYYREALKAGQAWEMAGVDKAYIRAAKSFVESGVRPTVDDLAGAYPDANRRHLELAILEATGEAEGQLYEVEIPDDDGLLDYESAFDAQPDKVKKVLEGLFSPEELAWFDASRALDEMREKTGTKGDEYAALYDTVEAMTEQVERGVYDRFGTWGAPSGSAMYRYLSDTLGSPEAASKHLHSLGIEGLRYLDSGSRSKGDGSYNYVIFDDKAIEILNTFYQQQRRMQEKKGSIRFFTNAATGEQTQKPIATLFEASDASTFMHESAHHFLNDFMDAMNSQQLEGETLKEFRALDKWLRFKKDEDGRFFATEAQHERFAVGFEEYLRTGKAPKAAPWLQGVFDKFKAWLTKIFGQARTTGIEITPEIRDIYDSFLTTAEERGADSQENPSTTEDTASPLYGAETTVKVPGFKEPLKVRYRVVEASDLVTSHSTKMSVNKEYPAELQPRDRERAASLQQIEQMAADLDTDRLGAGKFSNESGAPILAPDGNVVVVGNGRSIAIKAAYERGTANSYAAWVRESASEFGIDPKSVDGMKQPVLVREIAQELPQGELVKFANVSNMGSNAAMSTAEQAASDAKALDEALLNKLGRNGGLTQDFLHEFMRRVVTDAEKGAFLDADGNPSSAAVERIGNALFEYAYDSSWLTGLRSEREDSDVLTVTNALAKSTGTFAKARLDMKRGDLYEVNLAAPIEEGIRLFQKMKREGLSAKGRDKEATKARAATALNQESLFDAGGDESAAKTIAGYINKNSRSATAISKMLDAFVGELRKMGKPSMGLFGETGNTVPLNGLARKAVQAVSSEDEQGTIRFMLTGESSSLRMFDPDARRNLGTAKGMSTKGISAERIREKTGWFKGPDGLWRFEIDDAKAKLKVKNLWKRLNPEEDILLGDVLDHPDLFRAYPALKTFAVKANLRTDGLYSSYLSPSENTIYVGVHHASAPGRALDTLLHEIQHMVQTWEGYAGGGNATLVRNRISALNRRLQEIEDMPDGEVSKEEVAALTSQLEKLGVVPGRTPNMVEVMEGYMRIAGEVEARAVEKRRKFSPERRAAEPFERTVNAMLREEGLLKGRMSPFDVMLFSDSDARDVSTVWSVTATPSYGMKDTDSPVTLDGLKRAVPGAKVTDLGGGSFGLELYNGKSVVVRTVEKINIDSEAVRRDYGRDADEDDVALGATRIVDGKFFVDMVEGLAGEGTLDHELFETAREMVLTDDELAILDREIGGSESQANAYAAFKASRKADGRVRQLFQKLMDFFARIRASLFGKNSKDVFREVASGRAWKRSARDAGNTTRHSIVKKQIDDLAAQHGMERVVDPLKENQTFREKTEAAWTWWKRDMIDDLSPIREYFGKDVYMRATNALHGINSRAQALIEFGGEKGQTKSLYDIFGQVPEAEQDGFMHYAVYRHLLDIAENSEAAMYGVNELGKLADVETKRARAWEKLVPADDEEQTVLRANIKDARDLAADYKSQAEELRKRIHTTRARADQYKAAVKRLEELYPHWKGAQKDLVDFSRHLLGKLRDAEIISPELYDALTERYPNYVPLQRDFGTEEAVEGFAKSKGLVNLANPLKRLKGSRRDVKDPLLQIISNVYTIEGLHAKQRVAKEIVELTEAGEFGDMIVPVDDKHHGPDEHVFHVWENGKKRYFKTDKDIYTALVMSHRSGGNSDNLLWRMLSWPVKALRAGVTHGVGFIMRNPIRDTFNAAVVGDEFVPIVDTLRGMFHVWKKDGVFEEFMRSGAMQGMAYLDMKSRKEMAKVIRRGKGAGKRLRGNPITAVWEALSDAAQFTELGTRVGQYRKVRKRGGSTEEAAFISRDLVNYMRGGNTSRTISKFNPFFNAQIQGVAKGLRSFYHDGKLDAKTIGKGLLYLSLPSMLMSVWNLGLLDPDDEKSKARREKYLAIPAWQRNLFWNIVIGEGDDAWVLKIPKPFDLGVVFGSIPERAMDYYFAKDERAFKGFGKSLWNAVSPETAPLFMALPFELWTNFSLFFERDIVPMSQERLAPKMQYGAYTYEWAKWAGEKLGLSPRKLEYAAMQLTGNLGKEVMDAADVAFKAVADETRPAKEWYQKTPGASAFAVPAKAMKRWEQTFREERDDLDRMYRTAKEVYKQRGRAGLSNEEKEILGAENAVKRVNSYFTGKGGIGDLRSEVNRIVVAKNMSAEEKRRRVDRLESRIQMLSTRGLKEIERVMASIERRRK